MVCIRQTSLRSALSRPQNGPGEVKPTRHVRFRWAEMSEDTSDLLGEMNCFLNSRYDGMMRLLDLSSLRTSTAAFSKMAGMFDTEEGFTGALTGLLAVWEHTFPIKQHRPLVETIRLANNDLVDLRSVRAISCIFPNVKNLDLSHNRFEDLNSLCSWRPRFCQLEHILVYGNPLEGTTGFEEALFKRLPTIKVVNATPRPGKTATDTLVPTTAGQLPSQAGTVAQPNTLDTTTPGQLPSQADELSQGWYALEGVCLPLGWGMPGDGKTKQRVWMECATWFLSDETHMTLEYSDQALRENGWDLEKAHEKFWQVWDSIPPEGWMKVEKEGKFASCKAVEELLVAQGCLAPEPAAQEVDEVW